MTNIQSWKGNLYNIFNEPIYINTVQLRHRGNIDYRRTTQRWWMGVGLWVMHGLCIKGVSNHYHNMVGVAVAMVISTMHGKSCIDLHNARKFEKSSKIQSFKHLAITMMKLRSWTSKVITTIRRNYSESYFLQNWARILIWIFID